MRWLRNWRTPTRRWRWLASALFAGGSLTLLWYFARSSGGVAVAGLLVGLGQLVLAALSLGLDLRHGAATLNDHDRLVRAADLLAAAVRRQWNDEVGVRRLRHPRPLRLRWQPADGVAAGPDSIVIAAAGLVGANDPRPPAIELVDAFRSLPTRQLLILGAPGAGKSTLAILFVLAALGRSGPGAPARASASDPVPVLLTLPTWRPTEETLREWVIRRISEDYPELGDSLEYGSATPRRLVDGGYVLPVLDGLDELPGSMVGPALRALNDVVGEGGISTVILSRQSEYERAVVVAGRLAFAAVVTIQPITVRDSIEFLTASEPAASARWLPVTSCMLADPRGPVATALSTPLMTALARTVYESPGSAPEELCRLPSAGAVENHLLGRLLPSIYGAGRRSDLVIRAMTLLAHHLEYRLQTPNLAWWQLVRAVPRGVLVVFAAAILGALGTLTAAYLRPFEDASWTVLSMVTVADEYFLGLAQCVTAGTIAGINAVRNANPPMAGRPRLVAIGDFVAAVLRDGLTGALLMVGLVAAYLAVKGSKPDLSVIVGSLSFGAIGGMAVSILLQGLTVDRGLTPSRASIRLRSLPSKLLGGIGIGLIFGSVIGPIVGVIVEILAREENSGVEATGVRTSVLIASVVALTVGLPVGVGRWLRSPVTHDDPLSPRSVLRGDLLTVLAVAISAAAAAGIGTTALDAILGDAVGNLVGLSGFTGSWAAAVILGVVMLGSGYAWPPYTISRLWLALWNRLPVSLLRLLENAHRNGVLRQAGSVYQFRHARLQAHLGARYRDAANGRLGRIAEARVLAPAIRRRRDRAAAWYRIAVTVVAVVAIPSLVVLPNLGFFSEILQRSDETAASRIAQSLLLRAIETHPRNAREALQLYIAAAAIDPDRSSREALAIYLRVTSRGTPQTWINATEAVDAGALLATIDPDSMLSVYDLSGTTLRRTPLPGRVTDVRITPNGQWIIARDEDACVLAWATSPGLAAMAPPLRLGSRCDVRSIVVGNDNRRVALTTSSDDLMIADLSTPIPTAVDLAVEAGSAVMAIDPYSTSLIIRRPDKRLAVRNWSDPTYEVLEEGIEVNKLQVSGGFAIVQSSDGDTLIWDLLRPRQYVRDREYAQAAVAVQPRRVFVRRFDGTVSAWPASPSETPLTGDAQSVWVSADNRWLFVKEENGEILRWPIGDATASSTFDRFAATRLPAPPRNVRMLSCNRRCFGQAYDSRSVSVLDIEAEHPAGWTTTGGPLPLLNSLTAGTDPHWALGRTVNRKWVGLTLTEAPTRFVDFGWHPDRIRLVDNPRWTALRATSGSFVEGTHSPSWLIAIWTPEQTDHEMPAAPADPVKVACDLVKEGLDPTRWSEYAGKVEYKRTC
jgi:hypothetical protein